MEAKKITKQDLMDLSKEELVTLTLNLSSIVQSQNEDIANLQELYRLKTAKQYAPSSEQMRYLFDELEILDAVLTMDATEQENSEVAAHQRKKRKRRNACTAPANTPVCDVFHDEGASDGYTDAEGIAYERVADKVIDKIAIIPRKVVVERHHYPQYRTVDVEAGDKNKQILFPSATARLGASPSLVANILVSKFDDHLPFYRQEEIFAREGLFLPRQKQASWAIQYYEDLLPFSEYFKKQVYASAFLYKDETRVLVLNVKKEDGKPSTNGHMYITVGDTYDENNHTMRSLVWLDYIQNRTRETLFEDIQRYGYDGYLMTDGLKGYLSCDPQRHSICWVHAVRRFKDILKVDKKNIHAKEIVQEVAKLFNIDTEYRKQLQDTGIDTEQFVALRKQASEPIIDGIYQIVEDVKGFYSPANAMGKAISYLLNYRPRMKTYLDVLEATPSTNCCERVAKSFATGRKNWIFSQTVDGADASAFFYSLIETAKRSGLCPAEYVEAVCTFGPGCTTEEQWEALLPDRIDLSRLEPWRARRQQAKPDPARTKPYHFVGATR